MVPGLHYTFSRFPTNPHAVNTLYKWHNHTCCAVPVGKVAWSSEHRFSVPSSACSGPPFCLLHVCVSMQDTVLQFRYTAAPISRAAATLCPLLISQSSGRQRAAQCTRAVPQHCSSALGPQASPTSTACPLSWNHSRLRTHIQDVYIAFYTVHSHYISTLLSNASLYKACFFEKAGSDIPWSNWRLRVIVRGHFADPRIWASNLLVTGTTFCHPW